MESSSDVPISPVLSANVSLPILFVWIYRKGGRGERERVHARDLMPHGRFRENPEFKQEQYQFRCAADTSIIIANGQIER